MNRSRDPGDLQPLLHPLAEQGDGKGRGRAGTEAHDIALAHKAQAGAGGEFLFLVFLGIAGHDRNRLSFCRL